MGTKELLREIEQLPISKRMLVVERTIKSIREIDSKKEMEKAVDTLLNDYRNDTELIAFTDIDLENFYEAR